MTINLWRQPWRRNRPPSNRLPQVVAVIVVASFVLSIVGSLVAPTLANRAPLMLMLLSPNDRHLLIAATELPAAVFFFAGFLRQVLFDPFAFLFGFWFGYRVVDLFARRGRSPAAVRARFERLAALLVIVSPNTVVSMLAGASSMTFRRFVILNAAGTTLHLLLVSWVSARLSTQIEQVLDVIAAIEVPLMLAMIAGTILAVRRGRRTATNGTYDGTVAIIGAGISGLVAARELHGRADRVIVFEARSAPGGRLVSTDDIGGVTLDLGADWIVEPTQLDRLIGAPARVRTCPYPDDATYGSTESGLTIEALDDAEEQHLVDTTWAQIVHDQLVPSIADTIVNDCQITEVDYTGTPIRLATASGETYEADCVVVAVPLHALKHGHLVFTPPLPTEKAEALDAAPIWGGIKMLIEFADCFAPTYLDMSDGAAGERFYADATIGKSSAANVLSFVAVGPAAQPYIDVDDDQRLALVLAELDELFDGAATRSYVRHVTQDWSSEPFIHQAYLADHAPDWLSRELWEPVDDRIFFAGEAATRHDDWGGVHDAAQSALDTVDIILQPPRRTWWRTRRSTP